MPITYRTILLLAMGVLNVKSQGFRALQPNEFSTRIIGGDFADAHRYAYAQVSLQDSRGHSCGGSVVAPDVIMTAGHCAFEFQTVVVGIYNLSDFSGNVETFGVLEERRHTRYNEFTTQFDVALIKIDGNITVANPVRISNDPSTPIAGDSLTVVGWGATNVTGGEEDYPDVMHEVSLYYLPNQPCKKIRDESGLNLGPWLFDDMMCAVNEGKDSCYGDSGGPLVKLGETPSEDLQVGIVSWGLGCGGPIPGIYHRISYSYLWIQQAMCIISDSPPDYFNCNTVAPTTSPLTRDSSSAKSLIPTDVSAVSSSETPTITPASSVTVKMRLSYGVSLLAFLPILL